MRRIALGDQRAFARLFDLLSPTVLGVLDRMLEGRSIAEEILQETFLQAWQQAGHYQPGVASPLGWLITIGRSRALARRRGAGKHRENAGVEDVLPAVRPAALPAEIPPGTAELEQLAQSECIELAFFAGLTQTEIAARLNVPLGTVESRILGGMTRLRETLHRTQAGPRLALPATAPGLAGAHTAPATAPCGKL